MSKKIIHNTKKIETLNKIDKKYDMDEYKNKLLRPIKIEKKNINIEEEIKNKKKQLNDCEKDGLQKRTNHPYKGIIKKFDYNKKINNEKDLIIFYAKDEIKNDFNEKFNGYKNTIKTQDKDISNIYTEDKKVNYAKEFEYVQKYKYKIECDDPENAGDNLRIDRVEFYKKENLNTNEVSDIVSDLINTGAISDDLSNIDIDKIDVNELEKKLIEKFGKEQYEKLMAEL